MLIHFSQVILMQPQKKHIKKSRDSVGTRYIVNYCISLNTFTHTLKFVIDLHSLKKKYFTELMKIWNGKYHKFLDLDGMPSMISNISGHP